MFLGINATYLPNYDARDFMTGAACGAEHAYPSGAPDVATGFYSGSCCPFYMFFCLPMLSVSNGFLSFD